MSKRKICVVVTARTSYAKIKTILKAINAHKDLQLQVVCAASAVLEQYGRTDKMVERDGFTVNERVFMIMNEETLLTSAKATGIGVIEFSGAFDRLKPDAVLVMADRFEIMSAALAASYLNIPLVHVQGGEVSGNIDEKVRHAVTKLADVHFPATKKSRDNIIKMGENPEMVFWSGCPSIDLAREVLEKPDIDFDIYKKYGGVGTFPDLSEGYYLVMQHPVTTEVDDGRAQINETLKAMNEIQKAVLWFWPNVDAGGGGVSKGIRAFRENQDPQYLHFMKNMEPLDFLRVLNQSLGIIGNSSVAIREASYLGVSAVNIGSRQNARERGANVVDVGYDAEAIKQAVFSHCGDKKEQLSLYGQGDAGQKIADTLANVELNYRKTLQYAVRV
nr:UDP-N-acetylglucosamine 2-epimerase (hydrolyzing) [Cytophagales bacterium]